jgi:hypothetical protein
MEDGRTYWQQRPCHIPRNDRTVFADILSLKNIEEILPRPERPSPALVYAINGRAPRASPNAPDLYQTCRDGSTIKIDHVHRRFKPLNGLCRGLPHRAYSETGASLQVTIGIHSLPWFDLVVAAARAPARRNTPLREALPHGFLQSGRLGPDECDLSEALSELGKALVREQAPSMEGHFEALALVAERTGETRFMEAVHEFSVADIPGLAPQAKLVPARRLVNEAWLTVV